MSHQSVFDFTHFPALETQRLSLRKIQPSDVNSLLKLFGNPEVEQFIEMQPIKSVAQANEWLRWLGGVFASKDGLRWGVTLKDDTFIGSAGLNRWNRETRYAEIGCDIAFPYWANGYGQETIQTIINFGWDYMNLNRIEASVISGDDRSVYVMKKLGFKQEGLLRQRILKDGEYLDVYLFGLLRCEYEGDC